MEAPTMTVWDLHELIFVVRSQELDENRKGEAGRSQKEIRSGESASGGTGVDLLKFEAQLLASIGTQAEESARRFSGAVLANVSSSLQESDLPFDHHGTLSTELERWFLALFQSSDSGILKDLSNTIQKQGNPSHLPLPFLLSNLELILKYGYEAISYNPHSELLWRAFIRSLSLNLTRNLVGVEQQLQGVNDLLLLD
jgi:hypothetical protein